MVQIKFNNRLKCNNNYFKYLLLRDEASLREIYANSIELVDWTGKWVGIEAVLEENIKLFSNDFQINVISTEIYNIDSKLDIVCFSNNIDLKINKKVLMINDLISINASNEITSIHATII